MSARFISDIKYDGALMGQWKCLLPGIVACKLDALHSYFAKLDKNYLNLPVQLRHRITELDFCDFIIRKFRQIENQVDRKQSCCLGSIHRCALAWMTFNFDPQFSGLAEYRFDNIGDLFDLYSRDAEKAAVSDCFVWHSPYSGMRDYVMELSRRNKADIGFTLSVIISFAYDIANKCGIDCMLVKDFFTNQGFGDFILKDYEYDYWQEAYQHAFLDKNIIEEQEKLKKVHFFTGCPVKQVKSNSEPRTSLRSIQKIEISKISNDVLPKVLTLQEIRDAKNDDDDSVVCGFYC
jgi:hypothetical protein